MPTMTTTTTAEQQQQRSADDDDSSQTERNTKPAPKKQRTYVKFVKPENF